MKFIHMADMHFDAPFSSFASVEKFGNIRRLEQREAFKEIINLIKQENIDYLFIAGDLYEHNYVRKSTIEFINEEFKNIPNTKVFITPGNHDPYIKDSYYEKFNFADNVYIFKENISKFEDENIIIYGNAFTDFFENENRLNDLEIEKSTKTRILISHSDINGKKDEDGYSYNPISKTKLKELNFDYAALGHIHNTKFEKNEKIQYAGSAISMGFDEIGEHGIIVGKIENNKLETDFIKIDQRQFTEYELNVENLNSEEEIIEQINEKKFKDNELVKIILVGNKTFDIDVKNISRLISNNKVVKVKDETKIEIDIETLSKQDSLKGLFIRQVLEMFENNKIDENQLNEIIKIGLSAM